MSRNYFNEWTSRWMRTFFNTLNVIGSLCRTIKVCHFCMINTKIFIGMLPYLWDLIFIFVWSLINTKIFVGRYGTHIIYLWDLIPYTKLEKYLFIIVIYREIELTPYKLKFEITVLLVGTNPQLYNT